MRTTWSFHTAGQLVFGPGAVSQLGDVLAHRQIRRALVITDRNLVAAGIAAQVVQPLQAAGLTVGTFADGEAEPSVETAWRSAAYAREFGPDAVVGVGGGSNMDLAKIAAVLVTHGGHPADYFGFDCVPGPVLPLVCIPTTAGTGSEVSHSGVLTDTVNQVKVSTLSNYLRPAVALVDPQLTYACPRQVTADAGIDALVHAIEAYTAVDYRALEIPPGEKSAYEGGFPLGRCLAEEAIALVGRHLVAAVRDGTNHEARDGMALAATLAGMAFSNCGVALVHALEYPLGGALHCSHGGGNGLLLPFVMQFNLPYCQAALARIAALLGEDVASLPQEQAAQQAIHAVERLKQQIGIPLRIRELGARPEQLPGFAAKTYAIARLRWLNPRPSSEADLLGILEAAF
jgi:alcohol dehydrogenase class IV